MEADEKVCPFCAETIKAAAIKCKHCGEMLEHQKERADSEMHEHQSERADSLAATPDLAPVWLKKLVGWYCLEHDAPYPLCRPCREKCEPPQLKIGKGPPSGTLYPPGRDPRGQRTYTGTMGQRAPLSAVADRKSGVAACPRCGGTQFTAKRSNTGKAVGFATLGVGGLIAPKSQVKCVACGLKFKRG